MFKRVKAEKEEIRAQHIRGVFFECGWKTLSGFFPFGEKLIFYSWKGFHSMLGNPPRRVCVYKFCIMRFEEKSF